MLRGKTTGIELPDVSVEALAQITCPHCRAGNPLEINGATREYTHRAAIDTWRSGLKVTSMQITLCWADGLRREFEQ